MLTPRKPEFISRSPELDLTAANFPAQTKKYPIPRSGGPIEAIFVIVQVTLGALMNGCVGYGLLNLIRRARLTVNDGTGAYDAVDCSGPGLILLHDQEGLGVDPSTYQAAMQSLANSTQPTQDPEIPSGSIFRLVYPIFSWHKGLSNERIRHRCMIPVQDHRQDPLLTLDFGAAAEISGVANPFSAAALEILVLRRDMPAALHSDLLGTGGYLRWDIRESNFDLAVSLANVPKAFPIPSPGDYQSLVISMLEGNARLAPGDLSANQTVNQETEWRLEAGGNALWSFRAKHLPLINSQDKAGRTPWLFNPFQNVMTAPTNLGVTTGAPPVWVTAESFVLPTGFGGPLAAGLAVQDPAVLGFDFLSGDGGPAMDLGGCLDANFENDSIKWELKNNITTPANQTSSLNMIGRRFRDPIGPWKRIQVGQ